MTLDGEDQVGVKKMKSTQPALYEAKNTIMEGQRLNKQDKKLDSGIHLVWKIDIVRLQETKWELVKRAYLRSLWECWCMDWCKMGSMGDFGSILLMSYV